jgi:hypothetical protein
MAYTDLVSRAQCSTERLLVRSDALQNRDRNKHRICNGPGTAAHRSASATRCTASGTPVEGAA